jgi:CRISPR-associated protein Csm3
VELTEAKIEVGIDSVTSQANPRTTERVVADTEFEFEIIYNVEDLEQWKDDLKNILMAMKLLEDSYLGGSGSRGYGKIKFTFDTCEFRDVAYYRGESGAKPLETAGKDPRKVLEEFDTIFNIHGL